MNIVNVITVFLVAILQSSILSYSHATVDHDTSSVRDTRNALTRHMRIISERHKILSENVANANTPGYKAKDIDTKKASHAKWRISNLRLTNPKHLSGSRGVKRSYVVKTPGATKINGNDVSLSEQMMKVASNQDEYSKTLKIYSTMDDLMNTTISGGR